MLTKKISFIQATCAIKERDYYQQLCKSYSAKLKSVDLNSPEDHAYNLHIIIIILTAESTARPLSRVKTRSLGHPTQRVEVVAAVGSYRLVDGTLAESDLAICRL